MDSKGIVLMAGEYDKDALVSAYSGQNIYQYSVGYLKDNIIQLFTLAISVPYTVLKYISASVLYHHFSTVYYIKIFISLCIISSFQYLYCIKIYISLCIISSFQYRILY